MHREILIPSLCTKYGMKSLFIALLTKLFVGNNGTHTQPKSHGAYAENKQKLTRVVCRCVWNSNVQFMFVYLNCRPLTMSICSIAPFSMTPSRDWIHHSSSTRWVIYLWNGEVRWNANVEIVRIDAQLTRITTISKQPTWSHNDSRCLSCWLKRSIR